MELVVGLIYCSTLVCVRGNVGFPMNKPVKRDEIGGKSQPVRQNNINAQRLIC